MRAKHKRCKRYNDPGDAHALAFSCFRRQPLLSRDRSRLWLIDAIALARQQHQLDLWAYVIMPEHAHVLFWPRQPQYDVSKILATIKQSVTRRALRFVIEEAPEFLERMRDLQPNGRVHHRFWQRGGHDRNVIAPPAVWAQIEYIHANPVRRGLCADPLEWYWSSAAWYAGLSNGPLPMDPASLPLDDRG